MKRYNYYFPSSTDTGCIALSHPDTGYTALSRPDAGCIAVPRHSERRAKNLIKGMVSLFLLSLFSIGLSSCDLDINDNPNKPTGSVVTPDFVFPAVVATTTYTQVYYFGYSTASYLVGYQVPGNGVSGFGDIYSYNFTSGFVPECWTRTFTDLRDLHTIILKSEEDSRYLLFGALAHIFKVYNYQLIVDAYGDVPYLEGLEGGSGNFTPKYDKSSDVYRYLVEELDEAIATLKTNQNVAGLATPSGTSDPLFQGDISKWIRFANNLKLRLLVRARGTSIDGFVQSAFGTFTADGFLKEDVLVNPGYNATAQENPFWATYHSSVSGAITTAARFYIPSTYLFSFYDGTKLKDDYRGSLLYRDFPQTPHWVLGNETDRPQSPQYIWHVGTGIGVSASAARGILKSRAAGAPLFTSSELYFLLAESALYGHELDGDVKSNFIKGIESSFSYLSLEGTSTTPVDTESEVQSYIADNAGSYLVNIDLASTVEERLESIITQKYLALNLLGSNESWVEFRRTSYPRISGTDPVTTFVSARSTSTRADGLPVRLIYPQGELNLNGNAPKIANAFSEPIFWDRD
jgi:hypothetical protein